MWFSSLWRRGRSRHPAIVLAVAALVAACGPTARTSLPEDHRITDDRVEDAFPAWSPDGRFLMWSRHGELVVARVDGSGMIEIGAGSFPSWVK